MGHARSTFRGEAGDTQEVGPEAWWQLHRPRGPVPTGHEGVGPPSGASGAPSHEAGLLDSNFIPCRTGENRSLPALEGATALEVLAQPGPPLAGSAPGWRLTLCRDVRGRFTLWMGQDLGPAHSGRGLGVTASPF